ncbi:MAG: hypothetical protein JWN93_3447 [Hyphomicrobiales bacterium]|nr:hypothetical protein [Hyphomicrobiales bacterium]
MIEPGVSRRLIGIFLVISPFVIWTILLYFISTCERFPIVDFLSGGEALGCADYWLNRYQTLVGGLIAFVGALLTVVFIHRQIQQSSTQVEEQRRRRSFAANATLPLALDQIVGYAELCISEIKKIYESKQDQSGLATLKNCSFVVPDVPPSALLVLKECIEYADAEVARDLKALVVILQLQHARFENTQARLMSQGSGKIVSWGNLDDVVHDALEVGAEAERFLPYGRGQSAIPSPINIPNFAFHLHVDLWCPRVSNSFPTHKSMKRVLGFE